MIEMIGNMFQPATYKVANASISINPDAICITTNGFRKNNGECVMGKGCAAAVKKAIPAIPRQIGKQIGEYGNRAMKILGTSWNGMNIVMFPVKPISESYNGSNAVRHMKSRFNIGDTVPGWACVARTELIETSAKQLVAMTDKFNWTNVVLPRPGCGAGELSWDIVRELLSPILDDRFFAITYR